MPTTKLKPRSFSSTFKKPKLFSSAFVRRVVEGTGEAKTANSQEADKTNISNTSSFRYDPPGLGLRSTQQVPLDWSKFENHTFFNSAEANVNVSFDKIINEYPFDGTRREVEIFLDDLTGFEKWVFDSFPKNVGQVHLTGSVGEYIEVNDFAGSENPSFSSNKTGKKIIDPGVKSYTIEFHTAIPKEPNAEWSAIQYLKTDAGRDYGFSIMAPANTSADELDLLFLASSGSLIMTASVNVPKVNPGEEWAHLVFTHNRTPGINRLEIYKDATLVSTSANSIEMGEFGFTSEKFLIGTGSTHTHNEGAVIPSETCTALFDDLRVFHGIRSRTSIEKFAQKNIYASDDLKLYYKFNEPSGSLGSLSNIVLDSSGNSLHSRIENFSSTTRNTSSLGYGNPLIYENKSTNPVLFPSYRDVIILNGTLLASASLYDQKNPNLITKMIPQHYLLEGYQAEGFANEDGNIGDQYLGKDTPGSGELPSTQLLASFLFVWAKYFDEMKIFTDQMSNILHVDYNVEGTVADQFLPMVFKYHGFDVPSFFSDASVEQFIEGENVGLSYDSVSNSLQYVQNQMWRRILVNLGDIVRSKGTLHSIKSLIRSVGINPDSTLKIREYGGSTERNLVGTRFDKTEIAAMVDFSGSLANVTPTLDPDGIPDTKPFLISSFLSSSRTETGLPTPRDSSFSDKNLYPPHGISSNASDGLLTSGSWTYEGLYKFENLVTGSHPVSQSLMRLNTTGSTAGFEKYLIGNVVAISGSSQIELHLRAIPGTSTDHFVLPLTGVNIFDGNIWSVSVGREKAELSNRPNIPSSSYFVRVGRQNFGDLVESYVTSAFYEEVNTDVQGLISAASNASGTFITIGSQSINPGASPGSFLNGNTGIPNGKATEFSGKVGQIRFWSKALTEPEWKEHVRNYKSLGVQDPRKNFNFNTVLTGAWERLRMDLSCDQQVTRSVVDSDNGTIQIFDYSQNNLPATITGMENEQSIKPETFRFSYISPKFDEAGTNNKVRVRSFLSQPKIDQYNVTKAPLYQIPPSEEPADDTRFTIDFSIVNYLDEDIITMFSTLDLLDNTLGSPELHFAEDYPDLENLRKIYFDRLTEKINLKGFFEFFKWFDGSIGMFIEQLLPRKTNYLGTNFVVESHMLERSKVRYIEEDMYLDENLRYPDLTVIIADNEATTSD